jgi:hypothetical protein
VIFRETRGFELFEQFFVTTLLLLAVLCLGRKRAAAQLPQISSIILPRHLGLSNGIRMEKISLSLFSKFLNPHQTEFLRA